VAADVGLRYTNAYVLVFCRFLLSSIVIVVLALLFDRRLGITREVRRRAVWLLGFVDAVGFLFQYVGQSLTNASDATLLANLAPVLVPVIAWRLASESISKVQTLAAAVGVSGLMLMTLPSSRFQSGNFLGDFLLFGASVSFALFIVLSKRLKVVTTGGALAIILTITFFLAPAAVILGRLSLVSLSLGLDGWLSSVYMGIACTLIPMVLYLRGLRLISSSRSGTLLLLEVLSGLVFTISILRQIPTGYEILASLTIVAALTMGVAAK
jgi:drug/metabolite transporter (DMT)-like permease